MEGQNDSAVHIIHTDPADLLITVSTLIDIAAIVACQEVGAGNGDRQVCIDLDQVGSTVAVLQFQRTFLGRFRLGDLVHIGPGSAVPHCVKCGFDLYGSGLVIDNRTFQNGDDLALMIQLFQTDGSGI